MTDSLNEGVEDQFTPVFEVAVTHDWLADLNLRVTTHDPAVDAPISSTLHYIGIWDAFMTRVFLDLLEASPDPVRVYDVGANIGWYALVASATFRKRGRDGKVYAFEPGAQNRAALSRSLAENGLCDWVDVVPHAVSDFAGEGRLVRKDVNFGDYRLQSALNPPSGPVADAQSISVVTLDGWRVENEAGLPTFIKMDIQASEPMALSGFAQSLAACPNVTLMLEWEPDIWSLDDALAPHGPFTLFQLDDLNHVLRPVDAATLEAERATWGRHYFDVLAVRGPAATARVARVAARFNLGTLRFVGKDRGLVERPNRLSRLIVERAEAVFTPGPDARVAGAVILDGRVFRLLGTEGLELVVKQGESRVISRMTLSERDTIRLHLPADQGTLRLAFRCLGTGGETERRASISHLTMRLPADLQTSPG
ncbi:FkbM family methyltransferase [Hyphobacterium sp.]|uniref:FkbM family methyltransferase n=1 Tax=Hyphobacterium sp. TaxID=2004662 RepID=UPI003748E756